MEELDDILYDDVEAKYLALQNKKKNRKKRRRKRRLLIFLVAAMIGVLYFSSDLSKVKSLEVSGQIFYTKEEVLKKAELSYDTRYILMPKLYIEWKLKQDPLIEEAEVKKDMDGAIHVNIKEVKIVGYFVENGKNYVLLSNGKTQEIKTKNLSAIVNFPLIDGFDKTQREKLAASFSIKGKAVTPEIIRMISEIVPYSTSYDAHMAKIIMQDGNLIYTSYDSIPLLNSYLSTIKGLNKNHACLWPDIHTGSIQSLDCSTKE